MCVCVCVCSSGGSKDPNSRVFGLKYHENYSYSQYLGPKTRLFESLGA